jgi:cation/acetate symporter
MFESWMSALDWRGFLFVVGLWVTAVLAARWVVDRLFPRMRHGDADVPPRFDPSFLYPAPPRVIRQIPRLALPAPKLLAHFNVEYWRRNQRLILGLLLIWLAAILAPFLAPVLNAFQILTGFPLGYYVTAQGVLIIFLGIIVFYAWRAHWLDRFYRPAQSNDKMEKDSAHARRNVIIVVSFTLGIVAIVLVVGFVGAQFGLDESALGWVLMILTIAMYAVIGISNRTRSSDEYYVAGRKIPAIFNGMAIAGDWMSAASFISMAGTLWLLGFEGLAYIIGWTGGYVLLALLLAPYLRKFGQYTIPDFIGARYGGSAARLLAALITVMISFTYVTAQVTGIGLIMNRFLGVNYLLGVMVGLGAVLFCSYLGGMRAITWTQVVQCLVLVVAYLVPVTLLSWRDTGIPLPQLTYGEALKQIVDLEAANQIGNSYVTPFNDWTPYNFFALTLCLMLGTAGMPHILVRFYTVPTVSAARRSVSWAMVFILMLYFTAPAYAAFSRWEVLQNVVGKPITLLPAWATTWSKTDLLKINDENGDGILQFNELKIDPDLVVLATPEIAGLPQIIAALVAAGGLAAALSTADGLLMVIVSALAHDIYTRTLSPGSTSRTRLLAGRLAVFAVALAAALIATRRFAIIVQMVAWVFSFAAATLFPVLVLGIFWKRTNGRGAIAGMLAGAAVTLLYMMLNILDPNFTILGITNVAAGIFGVAVNFAITLAVSWMTPPPPPETTALVESLRQPG